jgi:biotin carboxylase
MNSSASGCDNGTHGNAISEHENHAQVVIMVDPYSTGCVIAREIVKRGYKVICLWSHDIADDNKLHVPSSCADLKYAAEVIALGPGTLDETAQLLRETAATINGTIVSLICGGEHGVQLADELGEHMGLLSNGTAVPQRRDKKLQQELVKAAGFRSVRQAGGTDFDRDVKDFLLKEEFPVVVKPVESAGSDGVKLCYTYEEAKDHFNLLMNSQMRVGSANGASVLCQEFLKGKEYVVDHVSRDGVHKTVMVWVYDKRAANGGDFVYFGLVPIDSESEEAKLVIPYIRGVLDAMQVKHGASHGEVIMRADGPCLVEMNCRAHGGDGNWRSLVRGLNGGYSQVEATVDCYLDPDEFYKLPDKMPSPFKQAGQEVTLVSYSKGVVKHTTGFDVIRKLPSFVIMETGYGVGSEIEHTVDLFNCIGSVILMHENPEVVQRDHDFIRYLEEINALFEYESKMENLKRPRGEQTVLATIAESNISTPEASDEETPEGAKKDKAIAHKRVYSLDGPMLIRHMSNDRPELGGPLVKRQTTVKASDEVVVVVDPCSTGACIAKEVQKRTYNIIALWSKHITDPMRQHIPLDCTNIQYMAQIKESDSVGETLKLVRAAAKTYRVVACLCGAESGIALTDALSEELKVRTNGRDLKNHAVRRDKQLQQDAIGGTGLRSIRQAGGSTRAEGSAVFQFLASPNNYPMVAKPRESHWVAGSDAVKLCHSYDEAVQHFDLLMKTQKMFGIINPGVLCQEFLKGKEYVVDHVSRDGVHKTTMLWVYDKRPANGSNFVYFGLVPVQVDSQDAKLIIPYVRKCLDAMALKNGPSHAEVMMDADGPCLVEMNCRAHGGDGIWLPLTRALTGGYTQIDAGVDAYLDKTRFSQLPDRPVIPFKASGQELMLVSYSRGTVESTPGFEQIKELPSYVYLETGVQKGSEVDYTTDLFSNVGSVILMHRDEEQLQKDVAFIRDMEKANQLFSYKPKQHFLKAPSSIFTTVSSSVGSGANAAATHSVDKSTHARKNSSGGRAHRRVISSDRPDMYC